MIVNTDAKGLEVCGVADLSGDAVLIKELNDGIDIHGVNQEAFQLPSRLIAKTFKFRLIYGGTEYAYAKDPDFNHISKRPQYWREVIDRYYNKYKGIYAWHTEIVQNVTRTGKLVTPTGRTFRFYPYEGRWPRTQILNYPVQSFGADLMALYRVRVLREVRRRKLPVLLISTVHDSIVADMPESVVSEYCQLLDEVATEVPAMFEQIFGVKYKVPFRIETTYGNNFMCHEKWKGN